MHVVLEVFQTGAGHFFLLPCSHKNAVDHMLRVPLLCLLQSWDKLEMDHVMQA